MSGVELIGVIALGVGAGITAGLFGVGGGVLAVVALTLVLDVGQREAQATSLLVVLPVSLVGAWRQSRYGNLRLADGAKLGVLSVAGAAAGALIANLISERALEVSFALLVLFVASRLVRRELRRPPEPDVMRPEPPAR